MGETRFMFLLPLTSGQVKAGLFFTKDQPNLASEALAIRWIPSVGKIEPIEMELVREICWDEVRFRR